MRHRFSAFCFALLLLCSLSLSADEQQYIQDLGNPFYSLRYKVLPVNDEQVLICWDTHKSAGNGSCAEPIGIAELRSCSWMSDEKGMVRITCP